jgi:hypothetical protein
MIQEIRALADNELQESDSFINLPNAQEIIDIIETALNQYVYEPYILLEKRIIHGITGCRVGDESEGLTEVKLGSVMGSQMLASHKFLSVKPNPSEIYLDSVESENVGPFFNRELKMGDYIALPLDTE